MQMTLDVIGQRLSDTMPDFEWQLRKPLIERIRQLKREKNVVVLVHNY